MAEVTDTHSFTMNSTGSVSEYDGMQIETNFACTLKKVTRRASVTATKAYLYADDGTTLLDTQTFVGDDATFNYALANATKYRIVLGSDGGNYIRYYNNTTTSYPEAGTNIDWTAGVGPPTTTSANTSYNIISVTTEASITAPTVTTQAVTNIKATTATGNGNITNDGGDAGATRGMCWDTASTPTTSDSHDTNGTGAGAYIVAMADLTQGTHYYVRAYSINSEGTSYGAEVEFDAAVVGYVENKRKELKTDYEDDTPEIGVEQTLRPQGKLGLKCNVFKKDRVGIK